MGKTGSDRSAAPEGDAKVGAVLIDPAGALAWANMAFCDMTGYRLDELLGRSLDTLVSRSTGEKGSEGRGEDLSHGGPEAVLLGAGGKRPRVLFFSIPATGSAVRQGSYAFFIDLGQKEPDAGGGTAGTGAASLAAGIERIAGQYVRSPGIEAVTEMAGFISHDLRNIVFGISGFASFALSGAQDEKLRKDIGAIVDAAGQAARYVEKLRAVYDRLPDVRESVPAGELLDGVEELAGLAGQEKIETVFERDRCEGVLEISRPRVERALLQIWLNACESMPGGGRVTLRCSTVNINSENAKSYSSIREGAYLSVLVDDDGEGMDSETRERAMEPFFSRRAGQGHPGLGLTVAYAVIKQYGGTIQIYGRSGGGGTTVEVLLPLAADRDR